MALPTCSRVLVGVGVRSFNILCIIHHTILIGWYKFCCTTLQSQEQGPITIARSGLTNCMRYLTIQFIPSKTNKHLHSRPLTTCKTTSLRPRHTQTPFSSPYRPPTHHGPTQRRDSNHSSPPPLLLRPHSLVLLPTRPRRQAEIPPSIRPILHSLFLGFCTLGSYRSWWTHTTAAEFYWWGETRRDGEGTLGAIDGELVLRWWVLGVREFY